MIFDSFQDKLYYVGNEPLNECFVSRGTLSDNAFCKQWPLENIKETLPRIVSFKMVDHNTFKIGILPYLDIVISMTF